MARLYFCVGNSQCSKIEKKNINRNLCPLGIRWALDKWSTQCLGPAVVELLRAGRSPQLQRRFTGRFFSGQARDTFKARLAWLLR